MRLKRFIFTVFLLISVISESRADFVAKREELKKYEGNSQLIMIASTGRSGSTMLTRQIKKVIPSQQVLKTHLLPPKSTFKGKIIFIFSNPDQAAESALYMTLHYDLFRKNHFSYVETVDAEWLKKTDGAKKQTIENNLLSYDALGTYEHLKAWLYEHTKPAKLKDAQILAIKYENLWDDNTKKAIRHFLRTSSFSLPPKIERGHSEEDLYSKEINFRNFYNLGTFSNPRYAAYDDARILWEEAPPFQFLKIN